MASKRSKWPVFLLVFSLSILGAVFGLAAEASSDKDTSSDILIPHVAPLNPQFEQYLSSLAMRTNALFTEDGHGLGAIPSPFLPQIHNPQESSRLSRLSTLPSEYDIRTLNILTPVRDQGTCGDCWAFASFGSLESQDKKFLGLNMDFSENNLNHRNGFDKVPCDGGNIYMSAAYLARFDGPISEAADPYNQDPDGAYCTTCTPVRFIDNIYWMPVRASATDNDYIKQAVIDHGALYTTMQMDTAYFDSHTNTYYYKDPHGEHPLNHAVVIVGWDDNKVATGAPGAGAFIIRNSWGSNWGESGYFYVSYYDDSIAYSDVAYFDDKDESSFQFDKVHSYDPLGMITSIGYGGDTTWGANVFPIDSGETVTAVGFYAVRSAMTYEIDIFSQFDGTTFSNLQTTQSGSVSYPGYITIPLTQPVALRPGDQLGVVIKFHTPGYNYSVPLESPLPGYASPTSNPGESYISYNGSYWLDVGLTYPNNSVCIKAFSKKTALTSTTSTTTVLPTTSSTTTSTTTVLPTTSSTTTSTTTVHPTTSSTTTISTTIPSTTTSSSTTTVPPTSRVDFTAAPTSGKAPLTVKFTDKSTGAIQSRLWEFGDGKTSSTQNPSYTYTKAGTYTVKLTVTRTDGTKNTKTQTNLISVYAAPKADFTATPTKGKVPLTVKFSDKSTGVATSWTWSFGDGQTSRDRNPSHIYNKAGKYKVTLKITNPAGTSTKTKTNFIVVSDPAPKAAFSSVRVSGKIPLNVTFTDKSTGNSRWSLSSAVKSFRAKSRIG